MILKNNDQRKKFLENYQKWEKIHQLPDLGVTYYRYKLPTNAVLIATEWIIPKSRYFDAHTSNKLCLLIGEDHNGLLPKNTYGEYVFSSMYHLDGTNATQIIDYLRINKCDVEIGDN